MSILDVSDSFPDFLGNPKERLKLEKCEKDVAQEADIVFATADVLYERFRKYNFNTFHVPNGVDFDKYLNAKMPLDTDLIGRVNRISSSKVVGYQGAISSWFDFDLVEEVVRSNPELLFLFVGMVDIRVKHEFSRILKHANARYLGAIDPDALPWVISKMDVGIIPFKINDLIKATNPIKLYEYLAAGKPVLATSMPEVMKYHKNGIVSTAESPHTFSMILRDMVASSKNPDHVKERMKIASLNSWEVRFRQVMTIVDKLASSICQDS
jgi:glycosyltransferase involved in cell wall biosynthesis